MTDYLLAMLLLLLACSHEKPASSVSEPPELPEDCGPLSPYVADAIELTPDDDVANVVAHAAAGSTLVFADGTYTLESSIDITTSGLILRSMNGEPSAVILDGLYGATSIFEVQAADVTISGLTLTRSYGPAVHVSGSDANRLHLYDLVIRDAGEEAITVEDNQGNYADDGVIACSQVLRTDTGRNDASASCAGGIDLKAAAGWRIYGNEIQGFWCENPVWALRFHDGSRSMTVERNRIFDSAGLIALGDDDGPPNDPRPADGLCPGGVELETYGGVVRNNFLGLASDTLNTDFPIGFFLGEACDLKLVQNTLWSANGPVRSIQHFGSQSSGLIANNLFLEEVSGGTFTYDHNGVASDLDFVDAAAGDFHLSADSKAIEAGIPLDPGVCEDDIDRAARDALPDLGADEH